jgi:hypothetical protein
MRVYIRTVTIIVRIINFATSKNVVKSTMFLHRNIHKYSWTSPDGKNHNQIDHILIDMHSNIVDVKFSTKLIVKLVNLWWLQNLGKD